MSVLQAANLSFSYGKTEILRGLSVDIAAGSFWGIAGPNGAGKSTLLNLMCGALKPGSGKILVDGRKITRLSPKKLAEHIAVVRQEYVPAFEYTAMETVALGRMGRLSQSGFETAEDMEAIEQAMIATDTIRFGDRPLGQISSGERQRVFIARALAQQTPVIVLDEPTSFLDLRHQVQIYDLLKRLQSEQKKTIIAVTHDLNLSRQYCDHILLMGEGTDFCHGRCEEILTAENLRRYFNVRGVAVSRQGCEFFLPVGELSRLGTEKDGQ